MKKIYLLAAASMIATASFAQLAGQEKTNHIPVFNKKANPISKTPTQFYIDYDAAEENLANQYQRYGWDLNSNPNDSATLNNFVVGFDSIYDYVNFQTYIPGTDYLNYTLDSIFVAIGHVNTTGQNNELTIKVISLNPSTGYPNPTSVLWDTVITTNTSITGGASWLNFAVLGFEPNLALTSAQKVGVMVEYTAPIQDTLGVLAGFRDQGQCNTSSTSAAVSYFDPNTYATWSEYYSYGTLPTATGANIYYDCNTNSQYDANSNEESLLQNGGIWSLVTVDVIQSVNEINNSTSFTVYPNPSNGVFNINLNTDKAEQLTLTVNNIVGQTVMTKQVRVSGKTNETISLEGYDKGIYFLTIDNNREKQTVKLIVE